MTPAWILSITSLSWPLDVTIVRGVVGCGDFSRENFTRLRPSALGMHQSEIIKSNFCILICSNASAPLLHSLIISSPKSSSASLKSNRTSIISSAMRILYCLKRLLSLGPGAVVAVYDFKVISEVDKIKS